ncbi:hypothetical protein HS1genome_2320 [Sulfodiicoccus acidiphilus]|uniref:Uncharacterized protein n=1 Tax=Sulfodiicoccus acidiphilus TaxID=1670455 RepID=A0A348B6X9_9CREN|nr:hypothetical protein [Sulfodiicoccus acidiphilus]BBD73931.1 hypothetical protein HS1genome_2320 [Sulfodiicoccus acidiphilus]GGU03304.1 hypothetical protein GCM10007116_20310 [Sulfodiicoccus acidiphilus]
MPPLLSFSLSHRLSECDDEECIEQLADEYIEFLRRGGEDSGWVEERTEDEADFDKSFLFIEALLKRVIETDIEPQVLLMLLERDLGESHPVVLILKEELEGE